MARAMAVNLSAARAPSRCVALTQLKANITSELRTIWVVVSLPTRSTVMTRNPASSTKLASGSRARRCCMRVS
jgi:hypothetical protein